MSKSEKLRIVFMGSPDFAVPALEMLHEHPEVELVGVASNPDKRRGRGAKISPTPIKAKALAFKLPSFDVQSTRDKEFSEWIDALKPDLLIVIAFRILPVDLLAIPKIGSINIHASLLPKYRGAAPIHHAIIAGEKETGLTSFFLNEKMDAGQVIHNEKISVDINDTTGDVYTRLMNLTPSFLRETLRLIQLDEPLLIEQDDSQASPAPKLFDEHCKIDWSKSAMEVHNQIRGLSPFPGAYTYSLDGIRYNIIRTIFPDSMAERPNHAVGSLFRLTKSEVGVQCGSGHIILDQIKAEGKKAITGFDALNGNSTLRFKPQI